MIVYYPLREYFTCRNFFEVEPAFAPLAYLSDRKQTDNVDNIQYFRSSKVIGAVYILDDIYHGGTHTWTSDDCEQMWERYKSSYSIYIAVSFQVLGTNWPVCHLKELIIRDGEDAPKDVLKENKQTGIDYGSGVEVKIVKVDPLEVHVDVVVYGDKRKVKQKIKFDLSKGKSDCRRGLR